jgi:hypothetical protein
MLGASLGRLATTLAHPATGICETSHCVRMDFCGFCASIVSVDDDATVVAAGGNVGVARDADEVLGLLDAWGIPRARRLCAFDCDSGSIRGPCRHALQTIA